MAHYYLQFIAFKPSGKHYSSARHEIGEFDAYPAGELLLKENCLREDLDAACGLAEGTVAACDFTVVAMAMDDTDDPITMSRVVRHSGR